MRFLSRFVDSNDREIDRIQPVVDETNELETEYEALSDDEIRERIDVIKADVREIAAPEEPSDDELNHPDPERRRELPRSDGSARTSASRRRSTTRSPRSSRWPARRRARRWGCATSTSSSIGGIVLHQGRIAEMKTGEGKTLVAPWR